MKNTTPMLLLAVSILLGWSPRAANAASPASPSTKGFLDNPKAAVTAAFGQLSKKYPKGKAVQITHVEITEKFVTFKVQNAKNAEEIVSFVYSADGDLSPFPGTEETLPDFITARSFSLQEIDWDALVPFLQEAFRQSKIPSGEIVSLTAWKDWPTSEELIVHATFGGKPGEAGFARADAKGKLLTVSSTLMP